MSTLVCFHAHPDDEAIGTGGLMARAADAGHRVVLVCATRGEHGEPVEGVLADGEELWQRRVVELAEACSILGADEPRFLGYEDSGMIDEPTNNNPNCFWKADHGEAVGRLVDILEEVKADVLTVYDDHGGYGHPDHIKVHEVGLGAANQAGIEHVYESTIDRDAVRQFFTEAADNPDSGMDIDESEVDPETFGTPHADLSFQIDVTDQIDRKKKAITAHQSQVGPDSFFLAMPHEVFTMAFGIESFNIPGVSDTGGPTNVHLLPGL